MVSSSQLKQEMEQKGFHNVSLWARGVDTELFKPAEEEINQEERPYFSYLGRVAPEKNLNAFLDLDLPGPKMVIGDGPLLETLKSRYPDARFTGYKKGRELVDLLNQSRVFVFPSLTDTLGVVQLEAMACGVPVAAFPVDGPKSLIINGHNGWMHHDLKQAVVNCLDIDGAQCRTFAMQFTWEACTDQFVSSLCFEAFELPSAGHLLAEAA
jgi:glycosyltransferase involved in cell wall biosynthesis